MLPRPTQSVPGGFLFVFFGLLAMVFTILAGYATWLIYQKEFIDQQPTEHNFLGWMLTTSLGLLTAIALIYFGLRMAYHTPPYDVRDPQEPRLKF